MRHIPALDGVRALAALGVVACHTRLLREGYLGVDVFFVLSGFLITSILAQQDAAGGIRLWEFYVRRARRLYPALLVMVALYLLAAPFLWPQDRAGEDSAIALLYLSDYGVALWHRPVTLIHTWSLSVEEHFYLLWPLLLPVLLRIERKRLAWYLLALFLLATLWRMYAPVTGPFYRFDTRLSGLLLGSTLALVPLDRVRWGWVLAAGVAALWWFDPENVFGPFATAAEVSAGAVVMLCVRGKLSLLGAAPLAYLGRISYGLYLYHYPVTEALKQHTALNWGLFPTVLLVSGALAALSYHTIEAWLRVTPTRYSRAVANTQGLLP